MAVAPVANGRGRSGSPVGGQRGRAVSLLEVDPDLGEALDPARRAAARAELTVRICVLRRGAWPGGRLAVAGSTHVGLLLIDGVLAREVLLADNVSTELLGAGELIRPWASEREPRLLHEAVRWQVLADARLALLGPAFGAALLRFPEINALLLDRVCRRAQRLATTQAICQLNSVDRRLLALFWHLAERWGRMTPDGVVVPLTLSHRLLGQMVGARRPTVSTSLAALECRGELVRRADGTWLVRGDPPGAPADGSRVIAPRRRLFGREPAAG